MIYISELSILDQLEFVYDIESDIEAVNIDELI